MRETDVPSPVDLRDPSDAREWERTAQARPEREDIFRAFAAELQVLDRGELSVLELGSGPGFLAAHLLGAMQNLALTLVDFSQVMHDLARCRLGECAKEVRFLELNFKDSNWNNGLGPFDAVITNQAVHELRHKRYAESLHMQVKRVLKPGAPYLVCDHYFGEGGMANSQLYMSTDEQKDALLRAGFKDVAQIIQAGSLSMLRAA